MIMDVVGGFVHTAGEEVLVKTKCGLQAGHPC